MNTLPGWADALQRAAARTAWFDRVVVLEQTASTQDAARAHAGGHPGLIVMAARQTNGRGRLGRVWHDAPEASLAMTFVLPGDVDGGRISLAAGLAACGAAEGFASGLGLRWPNDVVARACGRKLAGVLIERAEGLLLVGIGINVGHGEHDWPAELAGRCCSLAQLSGARPRRIDVAERLVLELDRWLGASDEEVGLAWRERDTLLGTERTFVSGGREVSGEVIEIEPTSAIAVRTATEGLVLLPAMTTSLVHGA